MFAYNTKAILRRFHITPVVVMDNTQFYLWLPSNSSMDVFPSNTLSEFRVRLPQSITLTDEWEVALTEIHYPHSWKNVPGDFWNRFYIKEGDDVEVYLVRSGHYSSVQSIVDVINELIDDTRHKDKAKLSYDTLTRKITLHLQDNRSIFFTDIGSMLGFEKEKLISQTTTASREVDLDFGFHNLYVYCDIVQAQVVGDSHVPLLRIVPVEGRDGERVSKIFLNPQYLPISRKQFESIEVNIKRDTGEKVSFETGRVLLTLHLRRASPYFH